MSEDKNERARRLAEALRANLRRRKGQARDRAADEAGAAPDADASRTEGAGAAD